MGKPRCVSFRIGAGGGAVMFLGYILVVRDFVYSLIVVLLK